MLEDAQDAAMNAATSPMNAPSVAPADATVLRIVAGLHAGASRALAGQEMLVVGSGEDCDIVLADTGVAAHHALFTVVGGVVTLRALDAPLRVEGRPLHPGDPAQLRPLQRIDLGEAALAFGPDDDTAWDALFPAVAGQSRRQRARPLLRRLPLIAATAVLALAVVAVAAALLPRGEAPLDVPAYLQALVPQHRISQAQVGTDVNGMHVLSGTVESEAVRSAIHQQLRTAGINASLALRTGEDVARDVREVFRMAGMTVRTRYLGDGAVEVDGSVDRERFEQVLGSRAMADVDVARLVPGPHLTDTSADARKAQDDAVAQAEQAPVDIVAVVRGREPYVVDSEGRQYPDGAMIPGHGKLVGIASKIYVEGPNGEIKQIRPVTAEELAARAAAAEGASFDNVAGSPDAAPADPAVHDPAIPSPRGVDRAQPRLPVQASDATADTTRREAIRQ